MTQRHARILHTKSWFCVARLFAFESDHHFIGVNHIHVLAQQFTDKIWICAIGIEPIDLVLQCIALSLQLRDLCLPLLEQLFTLVPCEQAGRSRNRETGDQQQAGKRQRLPNLLFWNTLF